jgi:hypothetical protein
MYRFFALLLLSTFTFQACAATVEDLSHSETVAGLKRALTDASGVAVAQLGRADGFLGDPKVRIPLPPALQRIEGALRLAGMRQQADELVVTMNRAAEAAVPEARALLVDAIQKMTVQDARGILTGGDTAATEYFRRATEAQLTQRFLPIVKRATDRVGLAAQYNSLAGQAMQFGLLRKEQATIESYVTGKALEGLYLTIGEQERAIRRNPLGAASEIVRRVFGTIR